MQPTTLSAYLARNAGEAALADLIERIASACWSISNLVKASALNGHQGSTDAINPQGEVQKPLDILADEAFFQSCSADKNLSALISEEVEEVTRLRPAQAGTFVLAYDPLDGSSNAAGGRATNGRIRLLDVAAGTPHQRTSVILGAREETDLIGAAYS